MKRRIWIVAGIVAIFVSAWIIKKSQRSNSERDGQERSAIGSDGKSKQDGNFGQDGKPVAVGQDGKPVAVGQDGKPIAVGQDGKPIAVGQDGKPVAVGQDGKPIAVGQDGKPVAAGQDGKIAHDGSMGAQSDVEAPQMGAAEQPKSVDGSFPESKTAMPGGAQVPSSGQIAGAGGKNKTPPGAAPLTSSAPAASKAALTGTPQPTVQSEVAATKPTPVPTPDVRLKASPADTTCDEQWQRHTALFQVGADMVYMTNIATQRPLANDIGTSHIETIKSSSGSSVTRDIAFSSDHPTGILVLTSLSPASAITMTKDTFLSICEATGGRAASSALFKMSRARLIDIADDNVKVGAGTFAAYRMKLEASLLIAGKVTTAAVEVWMAKHKAGLPVKEVIRIPPKVFADHGSITISSQLAGSRKI